MSFIPAAARPLAGLLVVGLGASLPPLDLAVNVAFPAISAAFALDTQAIRWVVAAYVVCYASLMLAFGRLGDLVGYRRIFRAGLLLAAAAFVLCALAPDYGWLLAARMVQGVAAALLLSCAPALATSLYEEHRRLNVLGAFSSMAAVAGVVAPLLGGASIAMLGWAGVFWFRAPLALLTLLLLPLLPPTPPRPAGSEPRSFDAASAVLLAAGTALLLLAPALLQFGRPVWPAIAAALLAALTLTAFARVQHRAAAPLLPLATARDPGFVLLNLASVSVHFTGFSVPLLVPYFLARISGYAALEIGFLLVLWPLGMLAGSASAAPLARRLGSKPAAMLGGALLAAGQFALAFWPAEATPATMLPGLVLHGAGIGLFQVAYTDIVIAALPQHDRGVAGSLTILTRTIGIVLGAAALSAALQSTESGALAAGMDAREAFVHAFHRVVQVTGLAFVAFFIFAIGRRRPLAGGPPRAAGSGP